jgi:hypothetical protein
MLSKGDRVRFAADFGEAFLAAKKQHPGPVFLVLEEAQRYVPQIIRFADPNLSRCLGAFEEIAEVGRNFGVGLGLISLRPQKINKDVLNLAELVLAFQTNGVAERKAISEWVQEKGAEGRAEVTGELPSLPRGTALVWSPSTFKLYGKFSFDKKTTYDAGATPDQARAAVKVKPLDLASLEESMTTVVQEAKANDPKALRARVAELERELSRRSTSTPAPAPPPARPPAPEKPLIGPAELTRLEKLVERLHEGEAAFQVATDGAYERLGKAREAVTASISDLVRVAAQARRPAEAPAARPTNGAPPRAPLPPGPAAPAPRPAPPRAPRDPGDPDKPLSRCARALLGVIVQRGVANASQVSALSGYRKTSSSFDNGLSELRVRGLIEGSRDRLTPTEAGRDVVGPLEPLPSGRALLDYWLARLSKAEGALLRVIYDAGSISRAELSERSGYSASSSSFDNGLSGLRTLDLIHGSHGADISIAEVFTET